MKEAYGDFELFLLYNADFECLMDTLLIKVVSVGHIGSAIADLEFQRQGCISRVIKNRLRRRIDTSVARNMV